jgi:hypothetical protein
MSRKLVMKKNAKASNSNTKGSNLPTSKVGSITNKHCIRVEKIKEGLYSVSCKKLGTKSFCKLSEISNEVERFTQMLGAK